MSDMIKINDSAEIITQVDEEDNVIGPRSRKEIRLNKLPHRVTMIFV